MSKITAYILFIFSHLLAFQVFGQQTGTVEFIFKDEFNQPIPNLKAYIKIIDFTQYSDTNGRIIAVLPVGKHSLELSRVGFISEIKELYVSFGKQIQRYTLRDNSKVNTTDILGSKNGIQNPDNPFCERIDPKNLMTMAGGNTSIERSIAFQAGVTTNNEFSSQYRVRGGNFDENVIYVNGIEVYRPQMMRAGQQEGLGFSNVALVKDITFSTGGFESKYGDKLSSVLNIDYNTPNKFRGTAEAGILTQNLHLEGSSRNKIDSTEAGKFTYLIGSRHFSTTYLLKSQDTQGDYRPQFWDAQTMLTYSPLKKLIFKTKENKNGEIDTIYVPKDRLVFTLFGHFAKNDYTFRPQSRETTFGTINIPLRLYVAFEGKEKTDYITGLGALKMDWKPSYRLNISHIFEIFQSQENELFNVEGGYRLTEVSTNFGQEDFSKDVAQLGVGTYYRRARNYLTTRVISFEQKGDYILDKKSKMKLGWGLKYKNEHIEDQLKEWNAVDSADFVTLTDLIQANNTLNSHRFESYAQFSTKFAKICKITLGSRASYWSLNEQFIVSPRMQLVIDPTLNDSSKHKNYQIRIAAGVYQQPPFYRELRSYQGVINPTVRAQKSYHFIAGGDYAFDAFGRPFKLFAEAYFKKLEDIIPYEVDNVRIRYLGDNMGKGYAYGLDTKLSGEFIRGIDSWLNISYLNTKEDITIDQKGYIRRPSDQRFTVSFFFQDELPFNPTFKAHINYVYGSGLPFGPPQNIEYRNQFSTPAYHRVDLGFSKLLKLQDTPKKFGFKSIWIALEVFNLFGRANTVSFLWLKDVYGIQYGIPNYLSARLLNLRLIAKF